jgi:hypothetical protein
MFATGSGFIRFFPQEGGQSPIPTVASFRVRAFDLKIRVVARFENPLEKT